MRIKKINLKNIRSFENQEVEFPDGSILLAGDIGSGKTTILLAIEYALFGLQPGQKGSSLLRNNSDLGEVTLELEVDGKEIIIERKLRRSHKTVNNEYSAISINGEKSESSITELKTKILKLLGYPSEFIKKNNLLYRYTVYTPQEQMKQIILEDSEIRLNILRHIFGVDKYKNIRENVQILLTFLKEESKVLQGEIRNIDEDKSTLQSVKAMIGILESKIKEKELDLFKNISERKLIEQENLELEGKIKEKEKFEKEVEKTKILLAAKKESFSSTSKEIEEITRNFSEIGAFNEISYNEIIQNLEKVKTYLEKSNIKHIELTSQINYLKQNKMENQTKKERIFSIEICPTCLQDVSHHHKSNILNETEKAIVNINKNIDDLEKEKISIGSILEKEKLERANLEDKKTQYEILKSKIQYLEKSKLKIQDLTKQKDNLGKDITLLLTHIDNLKGQVLNFSKFSNLNKLKQEQLKKAFVNEKQSEIAIAEFKKELELTHKEITNLDILINKKEKSKDKLAKILDLNDWLSNQFINLISFVEKNVMMKLRLEFSNLFSNWFKMLVTEDSLQVHLDENFTPLILQGETEMDYSFLSGGERTAVALAYRLALNQTINSLLSLIKTRDIVMLDEPTDGFSDAQLDKIRDVLRELNVGQLIVVSHEPKIESFIDNIVKLKKDSGISQLDLTNVNYQKT